MPAGAYGQALYNPKQSLPLSPAAPGGRSPLLRPRARTFEKAADDVLASFGRALIIWTAALQDNDALLTPATHAFIRTRRSTSSGGYVLLTPPQVVRVRAAHLASKY